MKVESLIGLIVITLFVVGIKACEETGEDFCKEYKSEAKRRACILETREFKEKVK